jgi:hypothetical protein
MKRLRIRASRVPIPALIFAKCEIYVTYKVPTASAVFTEMNGQENEPTGFVNVAYARSEKRTSDWVKRPSAYPNIALPVFAQ